MVVAGGDWPSETRLADVILVTGGPEDFNGGPFLPIT